MDYVTNQLSSCVLLLLTGMMLGGVLDLYRVFRGMIHINRWVNFLGDLIFWIFAFIIITPLIYWSTWLELRFYVWLSLTLGFIFYYLVFTRIMIPFFLKFWKFIAWFPRKIKRLLNRSLLVWHKLNLQRKALKNK